MSLIVISIKTIQYFKISQSLQHQLNNQATNSGVNSNQSLAGPNNSQCSTQLFHVGLGQYVSDQEHFKNIFTV